MSADDWSDACDPVPARRQKALFPYEDSVGHQNYQRMADAAAAKRREKHLKDALAVDFAKPYGKVA